MQEDQTANIAATLAEVLPNAKVIHTVDTVNVDGLSVAFLALPKGHTHQKLEVDLEKHLPSPRRMAGTAVMTTPQSFLDYVARHQDERTVVWCQADPQKYLLQFAAVFDDHKAGTPGWRGHCATYTPDMSAEWKAWKGSDGTSMQQVAFAEFLQDHEDDISAADGMPTSLQMHKMATDFVMNEERVLKSSVRQQSGGVRLTYIADPDANTTAEMQLFEKFQIGIPVFHAVAKGWCMNARLKYRTKSGSVSFYYELIRADRVHEEAAANLIETIKTGLGTVPMMFGGMS